MGEERKIRDLNRHKKREDWEDPNTAGYWSRWFLWEYPTYKEAYQKIKEDLLKKGYITKEEYKKNIWKGEMDKKLFSSISFGIIYIYILGAGARYIQTVKTF